MLLAWVCCPRAFSAAREIFSVTDFIKLSIEVTGMPKLRMLAMFCLIRANLFQVNTGDAGEFSNHFGNDDAEFIALGASMVKGGRLQPNRG